jgi:hypothetical protein
MPSVELTDTELNDACMALRMAARRAQRDAAAQPNPRIASAIAADVMRYTALEGRFQESRQQERR